MKLSLFSSKLLITTLVSLTINCLFNFSVRTEEINAARHQPVRSQSKSSQDEKLDFSGDGRPGKRAGGGSRSSCPSTKTPLTALVPASNAGTTVSDRPSFWFYVPYTPEQSSAGEFVLQDKQENDVYRQTFTLPPTPGLVSLQLPQTAPALNVDRPYRWYFKLYCSDSALATANFVEGWVRRVSLKSDLATKLEQKKNLAYKEYGNHLIWFDALDSLARLRSHQDNARLKRDWSQLLGAEGVNLRELSQKPLVGKVESHTK